MSATACTSRRCLIGAPFSYHVTAIAGARDGYIRAWKQPRCGCQCRRPGLPYHRGHCHTALLSDSQQHRVAFASNGRQNHRHQVFARIHCELALANQLTNVIRTSKSNVTLSCSYDVTHYVLISTCACCSCHRPRACSNTVRMTSIAQKTASSLARFWLLNLWIMKQHFFAQDSMHVDQPPWNALTTLVSVRILLIMV